MIVSKPIKVKVEIQDKQTGCTYVYKGANINDCIQYFQSLFLGKREYKILSRTSLVNKLEFIDEGIKENDNGTCKLMKELMDIKGVTELSYESIEQIRGIICGTHNGVCSEKYLGIK